MSQNKLIKKIINQCGILKLCVLVVIVLQAYVIWQNAGTVSRLYYEFCFVDGEMAASRIELFFMSGELIKYILICLGAVSAVILFILRGNRGVLIFFLIVSVLITAFLYLVIHPFIQLKVDCFGSRNGPTVEEVIRQRGQAVK